tara:strand:+ start:627 stop:797 length:171 start_codon:yes stop_codon:yes gene_type:complete
MTIYFQDTAEDYEKAKEYLQQIDYLDTFGTTSWAVNGSQLVNIANEIKSANNYEEE